MNSYNSEFTEIIHILKQAPKSAIFLTFTIYTIYISLHKKQFKSFESFLMLITNSNQEDRFYYSDEDDFGSFSKLKHARMVFCG